MRRALLAACAAACAFPAVAPAAQPGLQLGFHDNGAYWYSAPTDLQTNVEHAVSANATVARLHVRWREVQPTKPPSTGAAADPASPSYDWKRMDERVRALSAARQRIEVNFLRAPTWAEGPGRPAVGKQSGGGTWKPSPAYFAAMATAFAKRYNGDYPDPLNPGQSLPAIRDWEGWNEPNLAEYLSPQWVKKKGKWTLESARIFRTLSNRFYDAVKKVNRKNNVIIGGTAPFGDFHRGDPRVMPLRFWRELLCVSESKKTKKLKARKCARIKFDALNHHPYPIGPPRRHSRNADDIVIADVSKITKVVETATRKGTVSPKKLNKPFWITEVSWDSKPDPDGLDLDTHAQYLQGALYVLWKQGVDVVTWFNMRDEAPRPNFASTYQSGIFARGATPAQDTPKPAFTAFRFPFTAYRSQGVAQLWGKAPSPGPVQIQARASNNTWTTVTTVRAAGNGIFTGRLRAGRSTVLRAVRGPDTSLAWTAF